MLYINNLSENQKLFEALSSTTRLKIIELLHDGYELNMEAISRALGISNGALTPHIKKLADCNIIKVRLATISRGTQKLCSLAEDKVVIDLIDKVFIGKCHQLELDVGQYSDCKVKPTCGLADITGPLADFDLPQYFKYPEHFGAQLLWYTNGYLTYDFPNPLAENQNLTEIQLSFEISSEGPFAAIDYPANIDFYINGTNIGRYRCPGEFADRRGKLTPSWWLYSQYGKLKTITISETGTTLDGLECNDYTIKDFLNSTTPDDFLSLKISCEDCSDAIGGVSLFGREFGDYLQGIRMKAFYS